MDFLVLSDDTLGMLERDVPTWIGLSSTVHFWSGRAEKMMVALLRALNKVPWVDFPEVRDYLTLDNLIRLAEHPHLADSEIQRLSGLSCGEFSAMNVVNAEKEKQTFLRSKNVYGELDATNEMSSEKEK